MNLGDRLLVVFDGNCVLCNGWVRWAIRRDRADRLRFAPSSAPAVAPLMTGFGALSVPQASPGAVPGTVVVFRRPGQPGQQTLVRSAAVLAVLAELPGIWPWIARMLGWVPRGFADAVYDLVARFRYRIWGRLESCPIPTVVERSRFLESPDSAPESC